MEFKTIIDMVIQIFSIQFQVLDYSINLLQVFIFACIATLITSAILKIFDN